MGTAECLARSQGEWALLIGFWAVYVVQGGGLDFDIRIEEMEEALHVEFRSRTQVFGSFHLLCVYCSLATFTLLMEGQKSLDVHNEGQSRLHAPTNTYTSGGYETGVHALIPTQVKQSNQHAV